MNNQPLLEAYNQIEEANKKAKPASPLNPSLHNPEGDHTVAAIVNPHVIEELLRDAMQQYDSDGFWVDDAEEGSGMFDNCTLIHDVIGALKQHGYTLQLVKSKPGEEQAKF